MSSIRFYFMSSRKSFYVVLIFLMFLCLLRLMAPDSVMSRKEGSTATMDEPGVSAFVKSRWDQFENSEQNLDRLDGLKRRREGFHATMEDYLQLPDDIEQEVLDAAPGKKRVRWADLEERKQQEKMRAIGFVVGQTDWSRMTDPTFGESALTRTKYI